MLELGISQAQAQFTKLLTQTVFIVDKKARQKKAVILPYEEYERLLKSSLLISVPVVFTLFGTKLFSDDCCD